MAMDFFKVRYPDTPVVFDMSLVYIVVAFLTVLGNNLLVETFTLNSRINFGIYPKNQLLKICFNAFYRIYHVLYHFMVCCCL